MKQGKLIRRAVSAALAGCMMFTFSAPALAESTDALMQLSMTRRSAVSVLDAENSGTDANASVATKYGITIEIYGRDKVEVDSDNCNNILGFLKYDPDKQKLTLLNPSADAVHYLTIDAPNTDVVLESTKMIVNFNLLIENARSVKVSSNSLWTPVGEKVYIYCACPVTLEHTGAGANHGVASSGIEFAAPVSASDFVYYTSNAADAKPTDAGTGTIPASTVNYLRIVPKASYTITADDATITVDGKAVTSVHEGEKVTVTAAGKENAEFTGWTAEGITLTKEQKANPTVTFTMPGNNVTLIPNYNVVQDFGIYVDDKPVTSENYQNLKSGRIVYDPVQKTLTAANRIKNLLKVRAPETDVILNGGIGRGDLTIGQQDYPSVVGADDVTVTSDQYAAIDGWVYINCTGKVDIRSNEDVAVNGNLNIYDSSEVILSADSSAVTGSANITSNGDVTIESTDGRAAKNLTIDKADNVTVIIKDTQAISENTKITASGTVILKNTAEGGPVGTVDFTQADGKKYVYYTSEAEDAKLIDPRIHPLAEAAGSSYLRIEPRETYYSITVANGTAQVGDDTTGLNTAFEGETVTVKANAPTDEDAAKGVKFHHWKVEEGSASFAPTAGSLGSATEAGTAEISFDMPKGNVKLTAVYSIPASVLRSTVTVEGGTAKSTLGEGGDIPAEIGTTVEITATPYDAEKYPGMEFVEWEIKYPDSFYEKFPDGIPENLQLKLDNAKSATTTFKMPVYPVKLIAHWSASPVAKPDPDEPIDEDFGVEPAPMDTTGGAIAAVAVGGAAIWGGYEIATRVILHDLLPEGAAIPANRGQLALLIWTEKGKPEPAGAPAFADVTDPDMAKAAQWCTEQGTMDAKGDRFEPEGWTPKFKVIEVWNKAFPKQ